MTRRSVYQIIEADEKFSILLKILNKTGIGKAIQHEEKPFTLFAPTDGAFYQMFQNAPAAAPLDTGKILVGAILGQHIVPGVRLLTDDLRRTAAVVNLEGESLQIRQDEHRLFINNAQIITPASPAANGVVFAIDKVLFAETDDKLNNVSIG